MGTEPGTFRRALREAKAGRSASALRPALFLHRMAVNDTIKSKAGRERTAVPRLLFPHTGGTEAAEEADHRCQLFPDENGPEAAGGPD